MSRFSSLRRFAHPRTFSSQLLASMLIGSLVPLLLISLLAGQTIRSQLRNMNELSADWSERNYIIAYEANIQEQVNAIGAELRQVETAVLVAKSMAESLFSDRGREQSISPLALVYDERTRSFREPRPDGLGTVSISFASGAGKPTFEQTRDLAMVKPLYPIFKSIQSNNPTIVNMYYIHPQSGSFFYPEYDGPAEKDMGPIQDLTTYSFYFQALSVPPGQERIVWTKPYFDITPRGWMFTATTPVYDSSGKLRGVVAADVQIQRFVKNVLDARFADEEGFALLLDQEYDLIAVQDRGTDEIAKLDMASLFGPGHDNGFRNLPLLGEQHEVFSRRIPSTGWILGYIVPERKLLEPVNAASEELQRNSGEKLFGQLALLSGLAVGLSLLLAYYMQSRLARPVSLLSDAFARMEDGTFEGKLHDTQTMEFNHLLNAFNRMSAKIRALLEEQSALNQELEHKVDKRTEELRVMNQELELRIDQLIRMESWRKRLFMNISHDLKTPITLIRGYVEAINDGTIPPESVGSFLRRIDEETRTITRFVRNLTELSMLETRQQQASFESLAIRDLYAATADKWSAFASVEKREFRISPLPPDERAVVNVDRHLMARLLDNLIENAMKYSAAGSPVAFECRVDEDCAALSVIDSGAGIPEAELPHVFDSFYRVDKSRNSHVPGSGLGLAIAKEIAAMHDSRLTVSLNEGAPGCTFTLIMPILLNNRD